MKYYCIFCNIEYEVDEERFKCEACNQPLIIKYDQYREKGFVKNTSRTIWRFGYLPHSHSSVVSLGEGLTFLHRAIGLEKYLGIEEKIFLKDESRNPTGSFVDRGVSVAVSHSLKLGVREVVTVSPGNLGASVAAYAAKAHLKSTVYLSKYVEMGKLYQILMHGGYIELYDNMSVTVDKVYQKYLRGGAYPILSDHPYYIEGIKTISYELYMDLGGDVPEFVVVPMGNGALIFSIWKGFWELEKMGLIEHIPRLVGVQFKGSSRIIDELYGRTERGFLRSAPELSIDEPLNLRHAVYAIKDSGGFGIAIDVSEATESLRILSFHEGLIVELAAASTITALKEIVNHYTPESIVCILTGYGLKDPATFRELTKSARRRLGIESVQRSAIGRTKLGILKAIEDGYNYGYGIMKYLKSRNINISMPTIYQHLSELEEMGLIRVAASMGIGRKRIIYKLTERGVSVLRALS